MVKLLARLTEKTKKVLINKIREERGKLEWMPRKKKKKGLQGNNMSCYAMHNRLDNLEKKWANIKIMQTFRTQS